MPPRSGNATRPETRPSIGWAVIEPLGRDLGGLPEPVPLFAIIGNPQGELLCLIQKAIRPIDATR